MHHGIEDERPQRPSLHGGLGLGPTKDIVRKYNGCFHETI
jgi:hypothetical protein